MPRRPEFPITLKAGSTAIKIYYSPHRLKAGKGPAAAKHYDSYVVAYYRGGVRHRVRFNSLEEAQTEAQRAQTLVLNQDTATLNLSGKDRLIYVRAREILTKAGVDLDVAAKEYAEAKTKLGTVSLLHAADFYDRYGKCVKEAKPVPEAVNELLEGLRADKLSAYHVGDLERRLGKFAESFTGPIMDVTTKQIIEWLRGLRGKDRKGNETVFAPKTRNHYRNAVVQLFNFARDHGYLPKGLPTETASVKALTVKASANEILSIKEMKCLLINADERLLPVMALKGFAGIRTDEMLRIRWNHINWASEHILLPTEVTKTGQRRLIPMSKNLLAWLRPYQQEDGRICWRWKRPQALFQALDRHGKRLGIDVGANKFRNSFVSFRVALTQDVARVALESGNSPRMIQREYLELVTESEGKAWFEIMPEDPVNEAVQSSQ